MKKTLIACGVASALAAGSAFAADVQVYGLINTGLSFVHSDADVAGVKDSNKFSMENGQEFGSRWGLRGSEDLGNGVKLSFTLESGFESDTGALDSKQGGRLFGREASITLTSEYGALSFGRMPIFGSVLGANGLFRAIDPLLANYTSAMGSGYATASMWTRVDNAISYRTPTFAGFTGYAMYSFKNDSTKSGEEGKASADRYASIGLRYLNGGFEAVFVADTTNWGSLETLKGYSDSENVKNGYTYTLGGNYAFDCGLKVIAFGQYFENQNLNVNARGGVAKNGIIAATTRKFADGTSVVDGYGFVDGWGASLGVHYPVLGGTAKFAVNYRDMSNTKDVDFTRWTVAAAYDYSLSKRTALYAMAGYSQEKVEQSGKESVKPNGYEVSMGIVHRF